MEALATIGKTEIERVQRPTEESSLAIASCKQLPAPQVAALGAWMAETQANFPNQELPEGTPDLWLARWTEMAAEYGLEVFRLGLLKAIQDSKFFPTPDDIRDCCVMETMSL